MNHIKANKIVEHLSKGHTASDIAGQMSMSKRTVEKHIEILKAWYDCRNATHLVAYFLRNGKIK